MIARRIVVTGRVQGVFYRNWSVGKATELGVTGWVRNRSDGSVELHACGPESAVGRLIEACRGGPPAAEVEAVEVSVSCEPCPKDFTKRPSV